MRVEEKKFAISREEIESLIEYLKGNPYKEVKELIPMLQNLSFVALPELVKEF